MIRIKHLFLLMVLVTGCHRSADKAADQISLAGEWQFRIDSHDQGIEKEWFRETFNERVRLPGSMAENGRGEEIAVNTAWVGDIVDQSYFTGKKYEKYRQPGNIKIPFWLQPVKYFKGVAWYQKEVDIPVDWTGRHISLFLERCHWESTLFVNGSMAGSQKGLGTPHEYNVTELLKPGKNLISIRMDNRLIIPIGVNSHSISDHTQSNWNGITGELSLRSSSPVYIDDVKVFPDIHNETARIIVSVKNPSNIDFKGKIIIRATAFNTERDQKTRKKNVTIVTNADKQQLVINYKIPKPQLWSEFDPAMYNLSVSLSESGKGVIDKQAVDFGMREFMANGTRFEINGLPVFLRGTTECCIFPLTGYPPSDYASWEKVLSTVKEYGLNHVRFHSFCPPEAAFEAADRLGIYFHIECSSWANQGATVGDGTPADKFIYDEGDRILREYGNHPSFCMLAYGNEPGGRNQDKYLGDLISYWRSIDNRRVYTSAAGWPIIPENDYNLTSEPRIQHWGEGLGSIINSQPPQTLFDFRNFVSQYTIPTVSHEIGQWCAYPDFKEIDKYTGVLKAKNFEIFRETLEENNMGGQAEEFLTASGKLQVLCYKADIEAALRTPGFAGFEMLQLHDFPGQGTALVGILNPFFESKGYVTPEEFRMFCNETVPLVRLEKLIYSGGEAFEPRIEIAHFGANPLNNAEILCQLKDSGGKIVREELMTMDEIRIGNDNIVGVFAMDLPGVNEAQKLTFDVSIKGTIFRNSWEVWVYPSEVKAESGNVFMTDKLDRSAEDILKKGGLVLLMTNGKVRKDKGAEVSIGFSSIFWNTAWTNNQAPHTLGILCNPDHRVFKGFPTEFHSNWQWWDPVTHSQVMILDEFPAELKPIIQPIDTWFENRRLALAFEAKAGTGKLLVCSINMKDSLDQRPVTKQLLSSMLNYMNSDSFDPQVVVDLNKIKKLIDR